MFRYSSAEMKERSIRESGLEGHQNDFCEQDYSRDLVKLVRKLRWIGEDVLAKILETELRRNNAGGGVIAEPIDTD